MANFVVKVVDGKPVIFGSAGKDTGVPCYVFEDEEAYDAAMAEGLIPVGSLIFKTYDAAEMAGGPFDTELLDSDNAVQNRVVKAAIDRIDQSIAEALALRASLTGFGLAKICPVDVTDVTEADGLLLGAFEKNPAVKGTLANLISSVFETGENNITLMDGTKIQWGKGETAGDTAAFADIKFPVEFSNNPVIVATPILYNSNHFSVVQVAGSRKDGFFAWAFRDAITSSVANEQFYWIAIGK